MKFRNRAKTFLCLVPFFFLNCSPDLSDDEIPLISFPEIVINLSLPAYNSLATKGYQYIDGGVRGLILYRNPVNNQYLAIERNCSYHPGEACSTVEIHSSGLYLFDPCCNSTFDWSGAVTGGVAWRPLRLYEAFLSGGTLTITDTPLR